MGRTVADCCVMLLAAVSSIESSHAPEELGEPWALPVYLEP